MDIIKIKLKHIVIFVGLISLFLIMSNFFTMERYNKIYDYDSQVIVEQYSNKNYVSFYTSMSEDSRKVTSTLLLCGSEIFANMSITQNEYPLTISVKRELGDIKLLAYNNSDKSITTTILKKGENKLVLNKGEYKLYLVGRWFSGSIEMKENDI